MFAAFSRYRPRFLTLTVFFVVAAVLVLANLSTEISDVEGDSHLRTLRILSCGWPLIWHRRIIYIGPIPAVDATGWYYSAIRLAGNLPIWLVMLAAPVAGCEWLLRRRRLRLRWSLRTMLLAVGLVAAFCGWYAAARRRASLQDPVIAATEASDSLVVLERWGPQWLDFLGADPYRRYVVGAKFGDSYIRGRNLADEEVEEHLKRLSRLRTLRYLSLSVDRVTPAMTDALKEMRHLRVLNVAEDPAWRDDRHPDRSSRQCLAAIGELTQLQELRLENLVIASESLKSLENLTRLRSLSFDSCFRSDHWNDEVTVDHPPMFGQLPALPQLEELVLAVDDVDDRDLRRIAALPRLKSLRLVRPAVTSDGLAELEALKSLEELEIHDRLSDVVVTAAGLESLTKVQRLKTLHIDRYARMQEGSGSIDTITLDNDGRIAVPVSEVDAYRRGLAGLRRAKPGIVIDSSGYYSYSNDWRAEEKIPWYDEVDAMNSRGMLLQLPPGAFLQTLPAEVDDEFRSLKW